MNCQIPPHTHNTFRAGARPVIPGAKGFAPGLCVILLILCLSLGGCIRTFDCSGYIRSMLDATYKGECDDYAAVTHSEVSDLLQDYNDFIAHETDIFLHFCGLTADDVIPEALPRRLTGDLQDIYRQVRYTVNESDREGNVTVNIESLDIYNAIYGEFQEFNESFRERNNHYEFEEFSDEEFTREYLEPLLDILEARMDNLPFREPVTITVRVAPDEDGRYTISDEEVAQLYNTIINYTLDAI